MRSYEKRENEKRCNFYGMYPQRLRGLSSYQPSFSHLDPFIPSVRAVASTKMMFQAEGNGEGSVVEFSCMIFRLIALSELNLPEI